MPYSFNEHTADIRMNVTGKTLGELFQDALSGMVKIVNPTLSKKLKIIKRKIIIEASDATALLIDFLNEALMQMHTERETYASVKFSSITEHSLKAELKGYKAESFGEDIKAATYHEADVKKNNKDEWSATIIFDI